MVETLLDFMLGPFRAISAYYFEHQLIFNTIVIGIAIYKIYTSSKKTGNKSAS
ncbi:hypothetical protein [Ornithinibacillus scapharcae]|uniref:hypothetical protein n=1 Tax=Ornithinibacillus scapharcae TaxID=1147159 RepID=UPI000225BD2D|nr:hypothetical protein [Ornithinibacillus scapharcae]